MRARPGLNQLEAVIGRLADDPQSRRAAISVYQPEDAVRSSCDIPCTFGLSYHIRRGVLHATTLMRSNNAFILLPYNVFEFSLLAEVVAAELDVPLGTLTHYALSMHIYEHDVAKSKDVIAGYKQLASVSRNPVPEIPAGSNPLEQIKNLVILEAELRHASEGLTGSNIDEWLAKTEGKLDDYWKQFYYLLLLHVVSHKCGLLRSDLVQRSIALETLESVIEEPWKSYLTNGTFQVEGTGASSVGKLISPNYEPAKVIPLRNTRVHRELREKAEEYERENEIKISKEDFAQVITEIRHNGEE